MIEDRFRSFHLEYNFQYNFNSEISQSADRGRGILKIIVSISLLIFVTLNKIHLLYIYQKLTYQKIEQIYKTHFYSLLHFHFCYHNI